MKSGFSIAILIILFLLGCERSIDDNTICSDLCIYYNQESSWTGWKYNITILYPDTLVIYEREVSPSVQEKLSTYLINKSEIDTISLYLNELSKINLADYYGFGPGKPTDLPITFLKYTYCSVRDSCSIYYPVENEVPTIVKQLLSMINRIVIVQDDMKD